MVEEEAAPAPQASQPSPELAAYVASLRQQGYADEDISAHLLGAGYTDEDVRAAMGR
jgi:hypothetical protein